MTRVLLVRHGQSEWNASGRWQGQADPELTELGKVQAAHAASSLGAVDMIVSSPLQRARRTAEIMAAALGIDDVVEIDALMERDAGEWQGLTRAEIEAAWPGALERRERPAGYEHDESLRTRAFAALDAIERTLAGGGEVVAVSHGGLITCVERSLDGPGGPLANLGAVQIESGPGGWRVSGRLLLVDPAEATVPKQI